MARCAALKELALGLSSFSIPEGEAFSRAHVQDTREVHAYLNQDTWDDEEPEKPYIQLVCALVGMMSELRYKAEEHFDDIRSLVKDKKRELALMWDDVIEYLTDLEKDTAPARLITTIAQQHLSRIELIFSHLRKVLQRERKMVHIAHAQQIDNSCLLWLSRQAGHTAQEKAGCRQEILAIVRKESFNTLENRILKDFCRRSMIIGRKYLQQYQSSFPDCDRVLAVKKMLSLFRKLLTMEEMKQVDRVKSITAPNYVLMHDNNYRLVWTLYKKMLAQVQMVEAAWGCRQHLCAESIKLRLAASLQLEFPSPFHSHLWVSSYMKDGCFLHGTRFTQIYVIHGNIVELRYDQARGMNFQLKVASHLSLFFFYYIPSGCAFPTLGLLMPDEYSFIIHEDEIDSTSHAGSYYCFQAKAQVEELVVHKLLIIIKQIIERGGDDNRYI